MTQNQGRRILTYPINKFEAANFVQMVFLEMDSLSKILIVLLDVMNQYYVTLQQS